MADLTAQITLEGRDNASSSIKAVGSALEETAGSAEKAGGAFDRIKDGFESGMGFAAGITGFRELKDVLEGLGDATVNFNGTLEQTTLRLDNLTGSAQASVETIQRMKELSDASPFTFNELETANERLLRFNFSADQSAELIKVAADAAAGMGAGAGGVDTITEAFGRMNSRTELTTRGIMSLIGMGVPAFDMLAKGLGVTTAQAEDLTKKGLIPSADAIAILSSALEQKYPEMAATLGGTFDSLKKTISDTMDFTFAELGRPVFDVLETAAKDWLAFLQSADVKEAVTSFAGGLKDALAALGAAFTALKGPVGDFANEVKAVAGGALQWMADRLADAGRDWAPWAAQAGDAGKVASDALGGTSDAVQALQFLLQGNFTAAWADARHAADEFKNEFDALMSTLADHKDLIVAVGATFASFTVLSTVVPLVVDAATAITGLVAAAEGIAAWTAVGGVGGAIEAVGLLLGSSFLLPIAAVAVAVGALTVAWINNFGDIQGKTAALWGDLQAFGAEVAKLFRGDIPGVIADATSAFGTILPKLGEMGGQVMTWIGAQIPGLAFHLGQWTGEFTRWAADVAGALPGKLHEVITSLETWISGPGLKSAVQGAGDMAGGFLSGFSDALLHGIPNMIANLGHVWDQALAAFKAGFTAAGGTTPGAPRSALDFSPTIGTYPGTASMAPAVAPEAVTYGTGAGMAVPAAGDTAGWAAWLQQSGAIPANLLNDPTFLNILLTGARAESGLNAANLQKGGGGSGLFQFDVNGGMGAGISRDFLASPEGALYQAQHIVPLYAQAYLSQQGQGLSGAQQAAYVASQAERPEGGYPGGAGWNNYVASFMPFGATPPAGAMAAPEPGASVALSPAAQRELDATAGKGSGAAEATSLDTLTSKTAADLTKSQADEGRKLAKLDTDRATADQIAAQKTAMADKLADAQRAHDTEAAASELQYKRQLEDQATVTARKREDAQIVANEQLAAQALVHSRTLQDTEIQYQQGLQAAATVHQRQLQDADLLANHQLQLDQTAHQRKLQDAALVSDAALNATAETHSRTLQDTEIQFQHNHALDREAAAYADSLAGATTDAQRAAADQTHQANLKSIADQATEQSFQLAHQRELQDAEAKYQDGLKATALAKSRADADAEQQYRDDLAGTALAKSRANADTEALYQQGLAKTAMEHTRALQDAEIVYQQGVAHAALLAKRADEDAQRAETRKLEDDAIKHKLDTELAAIQFQRAERDKQRDFDSQLEDARIAREKAAVIETANAERDAKKAAFDEAAAALIEKARATVTAADGDFAPLEAKMTATVGAMDAAFATADANGAAALADLATQAAGASTRIQTTLGATTDAITGALGTDGTAPTAIGVSDQAVELFASQFGLSWDVARPLLGNIEQGIHTSLGENGLIPNHIQVSNDAVIAFAKQWGISWPEAAAVLTTEKTAILTTFGDQGAVTDALKTSALAAGDLNTAIQGIKDKTITVTTNYISHGSQDASGAAGASPGAQPGSRSTGGEASGGPGPNAGSTGSGSGGGSDGGDQGTRPNSGGPGARASGGPVVAGGMYLVGEHGPEFLSAGSSDGYVFPNRPAAPADPIDYDRLAAAIARHLQGVSLSVGVDDVHAALLRKGRRGPLGLG